MQCKWDYNRGGVVEKRQLGWQFVGAVPRLAVIPCWLRDSERTPMKSFLFSRMCMSVLVAALATACASRAVAASQTGAAAAAPVASAAQTAAASAADAWPRIFESGGFTVTVYPPTLESWDARTLAGTCAFSRGPVGGKTLTYGTFSFTASTEVNRMTRMVELTRLTVTGVSLPEDPAAEAAMQAAMQAKGGARSVMVSLDRLEAAVPTMATAPRVQAAPLRNAPPAITIASVPTVLVLVQGKPALQEIPGTKLERVINTQMLLARDSARAWWLKIADGWMTAKTLAGPWTVGDTAGNADLAAAATWATTQPAVNLLAGAAAPASTPAAAATAGSAPAPATPAIPVASLATSVPSIVVSTQPAEVIVTDGAPKWEALGSSGLEFVSNTSGNIFRVTSSGIHFVLISGRWFGAPSMQGPWAYWAAADLPAAFHLIPTDSAKENVLASVPGTAQSQEAMISNAIPQMARVPRTQTMPKPQIVGGTPVMVAVADTTLQAVSNASVPTFMVSPTSWYAIKDGVWFASNALDGSWIVATWVPPAIYSIPASSPYYNVTFVRIYGSTAEFVLVGYTPGYFGAYVQDEVVVYGTGYVYDPYIGDTWVAAPLTYGYATNPAYNPWMGWGMAYGMGWAMDDDYYYYRPYPYWGPYAGAYGPHGYAAWGPGGWAATTGNVYQHWGDVNAVTRTSAGYNAWTGRAWERSTASAYNSSTGARAAGQRGYVDNAYTGQWAEGARAAGYNPETGNYATGRAAEAGGPNGNTVEAGKVTAGSTATGNQVTAAGVKTDNGTWGVAHTDGNTTVATGNNVYSTRDGQVYRDQSASGGSWEKYSNGQWSAATNAGAVSELNQQRATRTDGDWRSSMSDRWQQGGDGFNGNRGAAGNAGNTGYRSSGNSWGGDRGDDFDGAGNRGGGSSNYGRYGRSGGGGRSFGGGGRSGGGGRR